MIVKLSFTLMKGCRLRALEDELENVFYLSCRM